MKVFGFTIERTKAAGLASVESRGGWWSIVREGFTGAWQRNVEVRLDDVLTHPTVFACITLIAPDIGKLGLCLKEEDNGGIWNEVENPAYSPVLRKPNAYQTINKFLEQWIISKLIWGNTYVLKQRDLRGVVMAMYILDPSRVKVLVSESGAVYYDLMRDTLSSLPVDHVIVPAREIIHDTMYTLYHPLVGIPPLHASGLLATLGLNIVRNSANMFANNAQPGAILIAPQGITEEDAQKIQANWEANFSGDNYGRVAVLGGDLKYEAPHIPADKSQLTEQWGKTSEAIATTFHVPFHLVGGPPPPYNNIQALTVQYFTQCLQALTTQLQNVLDEGLGLGRQFGNRYGVEFDVDDLLWMDSQTQMQFIKEGVGAAVFTPNEGRKMRNLPPVSGGESPYLQEQNYSLQALAKRDAKEDPFATAKPEPTQPVSAEPEPNQEPEEKVNVYELKYKARQMLQRKQAA